MKPLFKWAGGKTKLIKKYKEAHVLPQNFDSYIEPFLGAGAMFVWAYHQNSNADFVLNDLNEGIINIYRAIKEDCDQFLKELHILSSEFLPLPEGTKRKDLEKRILASEEDWKTIYGLERSRRHFYYKLRYEHAYEWQNWSKTKEAACLYFLMKTCFNGIWRENANTNGRFGTSVGSINQKEVYDKDNILEWSTALQRAELFCGDFKRTLPYVKCNSFVFLDPPYRGSFQYGVDFDDTIQEEVIDYITESGRRNAYVMMSNRDVGDNFFEERKGSMDIIKFDISYVCGARDYVRATEILMLNTIGK